RYGHATLEAAGVLSSFSLLVAHDVALDAPDLDLDGAQEWADDTRARLPGGDVPPVAAEVVAIRDLELVDPARWRRTLELLAEPDGADELLDRLADARRPVTRAHLRALWTALAAVADVAPPDRVRAVLGDEVVVADAADALILDAPDLWPLAAARPLVLAPY